MRLPHLTALLTQLPAPGLRGSWGVKPTGPKTGQQPPPAPHLTFWPEGSDPQSQPCAGCGGWAFSLPGQGLEEPFPGAWGTLPAAQSRQLGWVFIDILVIVLATLPLPQPLETASSSVYITARRNPGLPAMGLASLTGCAVSCWWGRPLD